MNCSFIKEIAEKYNAEFGFRESLAPLTSFKIGGKCDALIRANCVGVISEAIAACKQNSTPYYIIGRGSNLLISDNGLCGVVIHFGADFGKITVQDEHIRCEAGASLKSLCVAAREHSLSGLEFAYGIPGTAGGALYMNAGAYDGEISDVIESCVYLDNDNQVKTMQKSEMDLSYRHSIFTDSDKIILELVLKLNMADEFKITTKMNDFLQRRKDKQPLEYPSAGSTFKRPTGDYASRLIEECGLKGLSVGGAEVSTKHSGFVVNKGGASFDDVVTLIDMIKEKVFRKTGIMLECEIRILE